jgi:hypothetical protein
MHWKIKEEFKRRRCVKKEQIKSRQRLSPVIRKMSRLIGLGKNLKKKKIAKSWPM